MEFREFLIPAEISEVTCAIRYGIVLYRTLIRYGIVPRYFKIAFRYYLVAIKLY